MTRATGWLCVVLEHSCPSYSGCPPRGRGVGGASSGMCVAVARKSRTFGMDMRIRVVSGDSLSQPWVARVGDAVGWVLWDYTDTCSSYNVPPPSILPEPDMDPAPGSLQLEALACGTYEHRLSGLKPPLAIDSVTLDHSYTSLPVSSWTLGKRLDHRNAGFLSNLVGNIAIVVQSL